MRTVRSAFVLHRTLPENGSSLTNRAENSHEGVRRRERKMQRFGGPSRCTIVTFHAGGDERRMRHACRRRGPCCSSMTKRHASSRRSIRAQMSWLKGAPLLNGCAYDPLRRSSTSAVDPGFLCEQMADCVGRTGRALGVDVSEDLL